MKFRLLQGQHVQGPRNKPQVYNADGSGDGNVIESAVDLCARFNQSNGKPQGEAFRKFDRVYEEPAAAGKKSAG